MKARTMVLPVVALGAVVLLTACSSAVPTDTPGVDQLGKYILRQQGPELGRRRRALAVRAAVQF